MSIPVATNHLNILRRLVPGLPLPSKAGEFICSESLRLQWEAGEVNLELWSDLTPGGHSHLSWSPWNYTGTKPVPKELWGVNGWGNHHGSLEELTVVLQAILKHTPLILIIPERIC